MVREGIDLELLIKPLDLVEGNEARGETGEGLVDFGSALVADGQAAEAFKPSMGALDHTPVAAEPLADLDPLVGNTRYDTSSAAFLPARAAVVGVLGVQL